MQQHKSDIWLVLSRPAKTYCRYTIVSWLKYITKNMLTGFPLLWFGTGLIYPYPSGLFHCLGVSGKLVPVKQPWRIWLTGSLFTKNTPSYRVVANVWHSALLSDFVDNNLNKSITIVEANNIAGFCKPLDKSSAVLLVIRIPIIKLRWLSDCLWLIIGIPIPVRQESFQWIEAQISWNHL